MALPAGGTNDSHQLKGGAKWNNKCLIRVNPIIIL